MNEVILVGNLCRDNEVRYSTGENATAILRNTIAVQRKTKDKATGKYESDFISIQAFGKTAEFVEKYFKKGDKIGVTGEIRTGSYTNKDGVKVYTTDVVVNNAEFVSSKSEGEKSDTTTSNDAPFMNIPEGLESELPFK